MRETMKSIMQSDRRSGAFRKIRSGAHASQMAMREEREYLEFRTTRGSCVLYPPQRGRQDAL